MNQLKLTHCKTCGAEIASSAKRCPSCGAKNKPPVYKRIWFWVIIVLIAFGLIGGLTAPSESSDPAAGSTSQQTAESKQVESPEASAFDGDCGITASAEMSSSIIDYPELTMAENQAIATERA